MNVHSALWQTIGVYQEELIKWNHSSHWNRPQLVTSSCDVCVCVNGAWAGEPTWRQEPWITTITTISSIGTLCTILVLIFFCGQCGQVLEGGQGTTVSLLLATILLYWTTLPFCFYPGTFVCMFRSVSPAVTYTVAVSLLLSRLILLIGAL